MTKEERIFNYIHSKTRMKIENTFGVLKERYLIKIIQNRFQILTVPLDLKTIENNAAIVKSCLILHNILIDINDGTFSVQELDNMMDHNDEVQENETRDLAANDLNAGKRKRKAMMSLLNINQE